MRERMLVGVIERVPGWAHTCVLKTRQVLMVACIVLWINVTLRCCIPKANLMGDVGAILAQEAGIVRLLIIDSIMATFRTDYCGRGELAERQQMLNQVLAAIKRLAEEWNLAVVLTNQMCSDPGATMSFVSDPKKVGV